MLKIAAVNDKVVDVAIDASTSCGETQLLHPADEGVWGEERSFGEMSTGCEGRRNLLGFAG